MVCVLGSRLSALALVAALLVGAAWADRPEQSGGRGPERVACVAVPARTDSLQAVPAANLFVRTLGPRYPGRTPVLMVHGTSASHNYWRGTQALLSRNYYTINVDLRGHGQSQITPALPVADASNPFKYNYELFANDIAATLAALNVSEAVHCAGISIGADICVKLATLFPARVASLALVNGAPLFRCQDGTVNGANPACNGTNPVPWLTGIGTTPVTLLPEDVLSGCNVTNARNKINQNRAYSTVAVLSLLNYAQKDDITPLLAQVKAPTLIMAGLGDSTNGIQAAVAFAAGIKNSVRANFVNRGHLMPITAFADVADQLENFYVSSALPEVTTVLDRGCQVAAEVAPEADFVPCPSV